MKSCRSIMLCSMSLVASVATLHTPANSIILRHDVPSDQYLAQSWPEAIVDMPGEGHGVLIAPEWVVTAAHVIFGDYRGRSLTIAGENYEIESVIFHPGYSRPPAGIFTGHSAPSQAYLRGNHDIALVKLAKPVLAKPMPIYRGEDEADKRFEFFGRGSTGVGLSGQIARSGGTMRHAENMIESDDQQWLFYEFDAGGEGLPREGIQGDGDSGGPAIIDLDGQPALAGLVSWDTYDGDLDQFQGGLYGMGGALVRMSYYAEWLDEVMSKAPAEIRSLHNKVGEQE